MGTVSVSLPSDGTTADVSDYNTPINTIVTELNGNLDNANIKSAAAIATSKLADDGGITFAKLGTGLTLQTVNTTVSAVATGTTVIPYDDTIPQITEGDQYMTLAITPKATTNILVIHVVLSAGVSVANSVNVALFQDATANALAVSSIYQASNNGLTTVALTHTMVAGTTSATTFRVRAGGHNAGTMTFNGIGGARLFGAITKSSIVITEYKV